MFYFSHLSLFLFRIWYLRFICYLVLVIWNLISCKKNKDFICNTIVRFLDSQIYPVKSPRDPDISGYLTGFTI